MAIKNFDIKFEKIDDNDMKKGVFVKFYKELLSPKIVTQLKEKVIMIIKTHVQPHSNLKDFINEHPNSKRLDEYVKKCIEISWRMHVVNVTQKQNPEFKFYPDNPFSLVDELFDKGHQCILNNNVQKTTFTDLSNSEDSSSDSEDEISLQRLIKKNKGKNNLQRKMDTSRCKIKQCTWPSIYHHQNTIHLKNAGKIEVLLKAPAPV